MSPIFLSLPQTVWGSRVETKQIFLRESIKKNASSALIYIKLLMGTAKAITAMDEFRSDKDLLILGERMLFDLGTTRNLLENMVDEL